MRSGLVALLAGEATISAIVGSRIYISKAPQKAALPHIIITQMSSDELPALDTTPGLRFLDFDIDCKADRSLESYTLGNAVRVFLDDYTGAAGSQTVGAVIMNDESYRLRTSDRRQRYRRACHTSGCHHPVHTILKGLNNVKDQS
jgi:hypothetical protein